jgi:hypothetical protein
MVLTAAFVGSEGRNLFLRSVANRILRAKRRLWMAQRFLLALALSTEQTPAGGL